MSCFSRQPAAAYQPGERPEGSGHPASSGDRIRLPIRFDPDRLAADLEGLAQRAPLTGGHWIRHFVTSNYDGDWSVVPLRGKAGATHPVQMIHSDPSCHDYADTPFLAECPYLGEVLASFACPLEAVRLMRLGPGSRIKEHVDHDLDIEHGTVRLHVPVQTNPDVDFQLNGTRVVMEPGSLWYLRLSDPHSVENRGSSARVHLVLDCIVNAWLAALLASAAGHAPETIP